MAIVVKRRRGSAAGSRKVSLGAPSRAAPKVPPRRFVYGVNSKGEKVKVNLDEINYEQPSSKSRGADAETYEEVGAGADSIYGTAGEDDHIYAVMEDGSKIKIMKKDMDDPIYADPLEDDTYGIAGSKNKKKKKSAGDDTYGLAEEDTYGLAKEDTYGLAEEDTYAMAAEKSDSEEEMYSVAKEDAYGLAGKEDDSYSLAHNKAKGSGDDTYRLAEEDTYQMAQAESSEGEGEGGEGGDTYALAGGEQGETDDLYLSAGKDGGQQGKKKKSLQSEDEDYSLAAQMFGKRKTSFILAEEEEDATYSLAETAAAPSYDLGAAGAGGKGLTNEDTYAQVQKLMSVEYTDAQGAAKAAMMSAMSQVRVQCHIYVPVVSRFICILSRVTAMNGCSLFRLGALSYACVSLLLFLTGIVLNALSRTPSPIPSHSTIAGPYHPDRY